ncbi:uncharacterized protein LOC143020709 [Oratosquilla oratoria]|uniref:uncharacterized protein LOC143020709 n=1 Tax=Oratosquilla oratoria TaxID=337810 RepID=UPI003F761B70
MTRGVPPGLLSPQDTALVRDRPKSGGVSPYRFLREDPTTPVTPNLFLPFLSPEDLDLSNLRICHGHPLLSPSAPPLPHYGRSHFARPHAISSPVRRPPHLRKGSPQIPRSSVPGGDGAKDLQGGVRKDLPFDGQPILGDDDDDDDDDGHRQPFPHHGRPSSSSSVQSGEPSLLQGEEQVLLHQGGPKGLGEENPPVHLHGRPPGSGHSGPSLVCHGGPLHLHPGCPPRARDAGPPFLRHSRTVLFLVRQFSSTLPDHGRSLLNLYTFALYPLCRHASNPRHCLSALGDASRVRGSSSRPTDPCHADPQQYLQQATEEVLSPH